MHVRLRNVQIGKKSVRHRFVIVLTCMDQHILQLEMSIPAAPETRPKGQALVVILDCSDDRRRLHEIGSCADDGDDLGCPNWFHVVP